MTASSEPSGTRTGAPSEARRAGRELVLEYVFRPLSNLLVPVLRRVGVPPHAVVLVNALTGLAAALILARGQLLAAAVLLQLKTLLDNTDGQLARATGQVTLAGRYLDTISDLGVNAAVFAALAYATGQPLVALAAFVALGLVLAGDYNATELYREARGAPTPQAPPTGDAPERVLSRIYALVFGPLDRLFRWLFRNSDPDRLAVTVLANLGLSTQLLVLGLCLVLAAPEAYLWFALACLAVLAALLARNERRARPAL
jgi:phosphatidylglycerophosphate synthase